jgi:hypothetical protein
MYLVVMGVVAVLAILGRHLLYVPITGNKPTTAVFV